MNSIRGDRADARLSPMSQRTDPLAAPDCSVHCFSSFTFSYLSRARLLARTLKQIHPDWIFWAVLVDRPPPGLDISAPLKEFSRTIYADELDFLRFESWIFKHNIVEACTAVKGRMMMHLMDQGADKIIYIDPDIAVFHSLDGILADLEHSSIVLTPHQVRANETEGVIKDNELTSLQYGIFNLGFLAARNDEIGRSFARWWADRLYHACYDEVERGLFTDQKWCDLVPALFDRVHVERDPGYNVASWNLSQRRIAIERDGSIRVNGSQLKFYHFTKINSAGDIMTEKYAKENVEVYEIWNWYKRAIRTLDIEGIPARYWHYDRFDNGSVIKPGARKLFRERMDLFARFDNPFIVSDGSFYHWLLDNSPSLVTD